MAAAGQARGYAAITDAAELQIAVRELHRVADLLSQFADMAAESVDVPVERAVGVRMAGAMVTKLIGQAQAALQKLPPSQLRTPAPVAGLGSRQ